MEPINHAQAVAPESVTKPEEVGTAKGHKKQMRIACSSANVAKKTRGEYIGQPASENLDIDGPTNHTY
jgi:hypothetical protein